VEHQHVEGTHQHLGLGRRVVAVVDVALFTTLGHQRAECTVQPASLLGFAARLVGCLHDFADALD
jgi:hypothetical protein